MSKREADYWSSDGQVFNHYGKRYCIAPNGRTVCIGEIDAEGKPLNVDDATQDKPEVVSKLREDKDIRDKVFQTQNEGSFETTKHLGGRPRKAIEDVGRVTRWRRAREEKEKQGVLAL